MSTESTDAKLDRVIDALNRIVAPIAPIAPLAPVHSDNLTAKDRIQETIQMTTMASDITYLKQAMDSMKSTLTDFTLQYAKKAEVEDLRREWSDTIKSIKDGMVVHNANDEKSFGGLTTQVASITKTVWVAMGGVAMLVTIVNILIRIWPK